MKVSRKYVIYLSFINTLSFRASLKKESEFHQRFLISMKSKTKNYALIFCVKFQIDFTRVTLPFGWSSFAYPLQHKIKTHVHSSLLTILWGLARKCRGIHGDCLALL